MFLRLCCVLLLLATGCSTNNCQDLCDAYHQMKVRCDLFGHRNDHAPASCYDASYDPQTLRQQAEYAVQQCRQDFRDPSCREQTSCCKATCFSTLLTDYDALSGTTESDLELQRDLCQKFRALAMDGEAPWCTAMQTTCLAEVAVERECTSSP